MAKTEMTTKLFLKKYHETRALICDAGKSIEDKLEALSELSDAFGDLVITEENYHCAMAMQAFCTEAVMRLGFQAEKSLEVALEQVNENLMRL